MLIKDIILVIFSELSEEEVLPTYRVNKIFYECFKEHVSRNKYKFDCYRKDRDDYEMFKLLHPNVCKKEDFLKSLGIRNVPFFWKKNKQSRPTSSYALTRIDLDSEEPFISYVKYWYGWSWHTKSQDDWYRTYLLKVMRSTKDPYSMFPFTAKLMYLCYYYAHHRMKFSRKSRVLKGITRPPKELDIYGFRSKEALARFNQGEDEGDIRADLNQSVDENKVYKKRKIN
jgi:hypothetical protein